MREIISLVTAQPISENNKKQQGLPKVGSEIKHQSDAKQPPLFPVYGSQILPESDMKFPFAFQRRSTVSVNTRSAVNSAWASQKSLSVRPSLTITGNSSDVASRASDNEDDQSFDSNPSIDDVDLKQVPLSLVSRRGTVKPRSHVDRSDMYYDKMEKFLVEENYFADVESNDEDELAADDLPLGNADVDEPTPRFPPPRLNQYGRTGSMESFDSFMFPKVKRRTLVSSGSMNCLITGSFEPTNFMPPCPLTVHVQTMKALEVEDAFFDSASSKYEFEYLDDDETSSLDGHDAWIDTKDAVMRPKRDMEKPLPDIPSKKFGRLNIFKRVENAINKSFGKQVVQQEGVVEEKLIQVKHTNSVVTAAAKAYRWCDSKIAKTAVMISSVKETLKKKRSQLLAGAIAFGSNQQKYEAAERLVSPGELHISGFPSGTTWFELIEFVICEMNPIHKCDFNDERSVLVIKGPHHVADWAPIVRQIRDKFPQLRFKFAN